MTTQRIHPDFSAFIACLRRHQVRFVVVGAHALAALGRSRTTDDLDVLVEPSADNAQSVAATLREFGGFESLADEVRSELVRPNRMVTIGRPPIAIDILTGISGVSFEEAWEGRDEHDVDGVSVPFLGLTQMVATKRAAGRTKDLLDLALLAEAGLIDAEL